MAINKRQDDNSVDEEATPTTTYEYSLPPIYTPLPSKTTTTPYVPINGFTTSIHSYTPIAEITDIPTPTRTTVPFYLPSYSPISKSVEPINLPALPTSSTSPSPLPVQENKQGLSGGVIAGIVIGAVAGVVLVCYAIYVLCWSRRNIASKKKLKNNKDNNNKDNEKVETNNSKPNGKNNKYSGNTVDVEQQVTVEESDEEDISGGDSTEKQNDIFSSNDGNQPITFPRFGKYDPKRRYSPTSHNSDLREDFRSYYKHRALLEQGSSSSGSSSSAGSDTQVPMPFYGGFNPYYGPMMQRQTPAIYSYGNYNMPMFTPQFMSPLNSSMPKVNTPGVDYFYQPSVNFAYNMPTSPSNRQ